MSNQQTAQLFLDKLSRFQPDFAQISRALALYSSAIALAHERVLKSAILKAASLGAGIDLIYETMLQSYLFLGFPRMLTAAECFQEVFPEFTKELKVAEPTSGLFENWFNRGTELCRRVYGENFDRLKKRISLFSPEIYLWMALEGYGKVLSRPGLNIRDRELAIVGALMMDNRPKQLYSHIRGALNVGVDETTLRLVINDLEYVTPEGYESAQVYLKQIERNV